MRRFFFLLLTVCFLSSPTAFAGDPPMSKPAKRNYQKTLRQLTQEGWAVWGKGQGLDKALKAHYLKLDNMGIEATTFESRGKAASANAAYRKAMHNASVQMAQLKGSHVEGGADIHITNTANGDEASSQTGIDASYRSTTQQNVNTLTPSVSLCREHDGDTEILLLFIINPK